MKRGASLSIAIALAALLVAAGCARPRNDTQIASEVQSKLYGDPSLHSQQFTIQSSNGIVTLNGFVRNDPERFAAAADAATIAGVKTVVNNLQVLPPQPAQAAATSPTKAPGSPVPSRSTTASQRAVRPRAPEPQGATPAVRASHTPKSTTHRNAERDGRSVLANKNEHARMAAVHETVNQGSTLPYSVAAPPSSPIGGAQTPSASVVPAGKPDRTAPAVSAPAAASSPLIAKPAVAIAPAASASSTRAAVASAPPAPPKPVTIPAGTGITVRLLDRLDSGNNHPGDSFRATLDAPLIDEAGTTVVPAGYELTGKVVDARSAGRFAGSAAMTLELTQLSVNGKQYALNTNQYTRSGKSRGKSTVEKVGGGAALGAILGGLFGGAKGAAIGATLGAGAGTGVSAAGKGQQIVLRPETALNFDLLSPISVMPTTQSPHGARQEQQTASATGTFNPNPPSNPGDDGPPVLKRRNQ